MYVTGVSATGKSAVCAALQRRGYDAHETDRDGIAVWVNRETGEVAADGAVARDRTSGWLERYGWFVVPARVEDIAARATGRLVFLCGSTENDREVWHLFSKVIYLTVDEATLRQRLATRISNEFGKTPDELDAVLKWHAVGADRYRSLGVCVVDATRPLAEVVDDVIEVATSPPPAP
jgi:gluconate kinase